MRKLVLLPVLLFVLACQSAQAQVRVDRLERLAAFLDTRVPASQFDISVWGSSPNPDDPSYVGCAGGWATKLFRQEGLVYLQYDGANHVGFDHRVGLEATQRFFGISSVESTFLFTGVGGAGKDPHVAAANIREVIEQNRIEQNRIKLAELPAQPFAPRS